MKTPKRTLHSRQLVGLDVVQPDTTRGTHCGFFYGLWEETWMEYTKVGKSKKISMTTKVVRGPCLTVDGPMWRAFAGLYKHYADLAFSPGVLAKKRDGGNRLTYEWDPRYTEHLRNSKQADRVNWTQHHEEYVDETFNLAGFQRVGNTTWRSCES